MLVSRCGNLQCLDAVARREDVVALRLQCALREGADAAVVFDEQDRFRTALHTVAAVRDFGRYRRRYGREINPERCALSGIALYVNATTALLHDTEHHR